MKLKATIVETVEPKRDNRPQSVIGEFVGEKKEQHFEVLFYDFDPYQHKKMGYMGINYKVEK